MKSITNEALRQVNGGATITPTSDQSGPNVFLPDLKDLLTLPGPYNPNEDDLTLGG